MYKSLNITFTIRTNRSKPDGEAPIYMRLNVEGSVAELSTGRTVLPKKWDSTGYRVKGTDHAVKAVNQFLDALEFKARDTHRQLFQEEKPITAKAIKSRMTGQQETRKSKAILDLFTTHNKKMKELIGNGYAKATWKKYRTARKHVKKFLEQEKRNLAFPCADIDVNFLEDFAHWLMTKDNPCSHNSARKYLSNFQKIVNMALKKKWLDEDPYQHFDMTYKKKDPVCLSHDELQRIQNTELLNESLRRVRDVFLFSCYTGLGFSDAEKLTPQDIKRDGEGEWYLYLPRTKTEVSTTVMLLPKAIEIIQRYAYDPQAGDKLLPMISNQKTNAYLKHVASMCGVNKNITHHVARHTFATTVALGNSMPVETVQRILGHASIKTTMHYARVVPTKVTNDMKELRSRIAS